MSRKANCWDNAPMESFFGTLKTEPVHHRNTARRELFAYLEAYYNRARIHSTMATSPHSSRRRSRITPRPRFRGDGTRWPALSHGTPPSVGR
jgi:transposase InsO family protein